MISSFLTFSCPFLRIFGSWLYFWQWYKTKRPRGSLKKKPKNPNPLWVKRSRASGTCIFFEQCKQRCLSFSSVSSFAFWGVVPSGSPPSLPFWLHTLPQQAFSDSCLQLLSLGQRFPNFSEIPLPAFHLVCQLPSDLFAHMFLLDVISSLIRKKETHILSSHPPPKQLSFPSCLLLFQPHPFPYSNLWVT